MTRFRLWACGATAVALAGCSPVGGDATASCEVQACSIGRCASTGHPGGYCIGTSCTCIGTGGGTCVESNCYAACTAIGGTSGSCASLTSCRCSGLPDAGGDAGSDVPIGGYGSVHGVVMSPGGVFPVSGALVYAVRTAPGPLPDGNYCPRCVDMSTVPHVLSGSDGSFRIEQLGLGDWSLVVQKGEFRRVRTIALHTHLEDLSVPTDYTTLPAANDPANGDNIPRIAVALGAYDNMEDILAKIHLAELNGSYHANRSTAQFDLYDNGGGYGEVPFSNLVTNPSLMAQYQIIFVPCSDSTNDALLANPDVLQNIRDWVAAGGKWYVADWSYEWVTFPFAGAIEMYGDHGHVSDADVSPQYDGPGSIVDADMAAWLGATGIDTSAITFREIFDNVCTLDTISGLDEDGNPVDITPKTWTQGRQLQNACGGGNYPYTVTFPFGCGRVLYTTYHTVGAMGGTHPDLLPQELILLYLVMEIDVCTDEVIIW